MTPHSPRTLRQLPTCRLHADRAADRRRHHRRHRLDRHPSLMRGAGRRERGLGHRLGAHGHDRAVGLSASCGARLLRAVGAAAQRRRLRRPGFRPADQARLRLHPGRRRPRRPRPDRLHGQPDRDRLLLLGDADVAEPAGGAASPPTKPAASGSTPPASRRSSRSSNGGTIAPPALIARRATVALTIVPAAGSPRPVDAAVVARRPLRAGVGLAGVERVERAAVPPARRAGRRRPDQAPTRPDARRPDWPDGPSAA